jgi:transcriptional regulator with XRE-family HTH domain
MREAAGATQQQTAERAGCSISYIRLLEARFTPADSGVLPRVRAALESFAAPAPSGEEVEHQQMARPG